MNKIYSSVLISLFLSSMAFQNACAGKKIPQWQQEMNERAKELEDLQRQNGADGKYVNKAEFPKTTDDLSFSARVQLEKEGLEPYKDMKAYRELNVKTAEKWCNDGEHSNSAECIAWRCSEGGKDASTTGCTTWRCAKPEYYNEHKEECERNKLCAKNNKSTECMLYRCYETNDKNSDECKKWKCENDSSFFDSHKGICFEYKCDISNFDSNSDECKEYLCGDCAIDSDTGDFITGPYSTHANCVKHRCTTCANYHIMHESQCAVAGQDCTASISDPHVQRAEYDSNAKCVIKDCETGWEPNASGTACEEREEETEEQKFVAAIRKRTPFKRDSKEGRTGNSGRGCFAQCDESQNDNLNIKALNPVMHKYYCADRNRNGLMVEFNDNSKVLEMTQEQLDEIKKFIRSRVADKDKCNSHLLRNYIMFIGTLAPDGSFSELEEVYLDD